MECLALDPETKVYYIVILELRMTFSQSLRAINKKYVDLNGVQIINNSPREEMITNSWYGADKTITNPSSNLTSTRQLWRQLHGHHTSTVWCAVVVAQPIDVSDFGTLLHANLFTGSTPEVRYAILLIQRTWTNSFQLMDTLKTRSLFGSSLIWRRWLYWQDTHSECYT